MDKIKLKSKKKIKLFKKIIKCLKIGCLEAKNKTLQQFWGNKKN